MRTNTNVLITTVISAAVAALLFVYPVQAGTGSVTTHNPGGGTTTTTVVSNYDGKNGEKVVTVTKDANGNTTSTTGSTYDANGKLTDTATCKGAGC